MLTAPIKKLIDFLLIFLKTAGAITKEFPKAASNGFLKNAENFMKISVKNCQDCTLNNFVQLFFLLLTTYSKSILKFRITVQLKSS
jgi:hypothetical protein